MLRERRLRASAAGYVGGRPLRRPLVVAFAAVAPVAVLAPLVGAGKSAAARRWRPLAVGLAISAAAVSVLATLGEIVERGSWNSFLFVYLPFIALALALWWVRSLSRERDRESPRKESRP